MKNNILTASIILISIIALILSLIQVYAPPKDIPLIVLGSYYYLGSSIILFILTLLIKTPIKSSLQWINSLTLLFYALFGVLLSLISLYASPNNIAETYGASLFFLASMISGSSIFYLKQEEVTQKIEIGKVHNFFRILILILIIVWFIGFLISKTQAFIDFFHLYKEMNHD